MCRRLVLVLVVSSLSASSTQAADGIPAKVLSDLKAATVYVKAEGKDRDATGGGFLIAVTDDVGYILTSHAVANVDQRGGTPLPQLTVVFGSGTKKQQVLTAEFVFADVAKQLVILKVKSKELPAPVDLTAAAELRETMTVYGFGFPAHARTNPSVLVLKDAIASLPENDQGKVRSAQLAGDWNAGHNGGLVVNEEGKVAGMAFNPAPNMKVATFIPAAELRERLKPRLVSFSLSPRKPEEKATARFQGTFQFVDPMRQVQAVQCNLLAKDSLKVPLAADKKGVWPELPGAQKFSGKADELTVRVDIVLKFEKVRKATYLCQTVLVTGDGTRIVGEPLPVPVDFGDVVIEDAINKEIVIDLKARTFETAGKLPVHLAVEMEPRSGHLFLAAGDGSLRLYRYPSCELRASYDLAGGAIPYQLALDAHKSLLYVAVSKSREFRRFPYYFNVARARGDILAFDVKQILAEKDLVSGELEAAATIPVDAAVKKLALSTDGEALYFLDIKSPDDVKLGRIRTQTRKLDGEVKLAGGTDLMTLPADRKFIYTASSPDGHDESFAGPYRGVVQQIDPATLKIAKQAVINADPFSIGATNQGIVFVAGGSGPKGEITVVDFNSKEKDLVVARWKGVPRACDIQVTFDDKNLLVESTSWRPLWLLSLEVPDQFKDARPQTRQQLHTSDPVTAGPLYVSPDGKWFTSAQGTVFLLDGGKPAKKD